MEQVNMLIKLSDYINGDRNDFAFGNQEGQHTFNGLQNFFRNNPKLEILGMLARQL